MHLTKFHQKAEIARHRVRRGSNVDVILSPLRKALVSNVPGAVTSFKIFGPQSPDFRPGTSVLPRALSARLAIFTQWVQNWVSEFTEPKEGPLKYETENSLYLIIVILILLGTARIMQHIFLCPKSFFARCVKIQFVVGLIIPVLGVGDENF
jgi:hypothetical protein